jgi:signal transduction histidine kinase
MTADTTDGPSALPLLTRSGEPREISWHTVRVPTTNQDARHLTSLMIGTDITGQRALREQREQQERLAAVGLLAATLAHKIRNPLNGACLHLNVLARALRPDVTPPDALEAVRVVDAEIKRLALLATDFVAFAKPHPLAHARVSLRAFAERVEKHVAPTTAGRVTFTTRLPVRDIAFEADIERLEHAVVNLINNAVEAIAPNGRPPPKRGRIVVRGRREPRHVCIEVEDDGPGLPAGDVPIFDAFFTTKPQGTGLGLAIAHRVVTDHDGTIDVDSRPGRTRFRVKLPLSRSDGLRKRKDAAK